ncbi:hypothetical protein BJ546DRAFT_651595 [Cryomyces antarcticus]
MPGSPLAVLTRVHARFRHHRIKVRRSLKLKLKLKLKLNPKLKLVPAFSATLPSCWASSGVAPARRSALASGQVRPAAGTWHWTLELWSTASASASSLLAYLCLPVLPRAFPVLSLCFMIDNLEKAVDGHGVMVRQSPKPQAILYHTVSVSTGRLVPGISLQSFCSIVR